MRSTALPGTVPWYRRRSNSWEALRALPTRSLLRLYLAIFFLFSVYGFYVNLTGPRRLPLLLVLALCLANGAYSVLYPWLLIRHPGPWIWIVSVFNAIWASIAGWLANTGRLPLPGPLATLGITASGIWILLDPLLHLLRGLHTKSGNRGHPHAERTRAGPRHPADTRSIDSPRWTAL